MAYISQITLPSGSTYDLRDSEARELISDLQDYISAGIHFCGTTTTVLEDGDTTNPILIDNESYTAVRGDMVIYGTAGINQAAPKEFIFTGTKWTELGSTGSLKALAFKDNASTSYTPTGTVSIPVFTGTASTAVATYTPAGSVSTPNFTGVTGVITASYEPAGIISTPSISVKTTGSTTTVNSITDVGTLPSWTGTVNNELLTIDFSQGTLPTKGVDTTVKTGDAVYESSQPIFTGTTATVSSTYTPEGNISQPTFNGTEATISSSYTPEGNISQPSFSGNSATITVS